MGTRMCPHVGPVLGLYSVAPARGRVFCVCSYACQPNHSRPLPVRVLFPRPSPRRPPGGARARAPRPSAVSSDSSMYKPSFDATGTRIPLRPRRRAKRTFADRRRSKPLFRLMKNMKMWKRHRAFEQNARGAQNALAGSAARRSSET